MDLKNFSIPFLNSALAMLNDVIEKAFLKTTRCEVRLATLPVRTAANGTKS